MPDHKTRQAPREYTETICDESTCEFYGQHAVQGLCFSSDPEIVDRHKLELHESNSEDDLARIRLEHYKDDPEEYIRWIEAHYLCSEVNWAMTLDECIRLRAENALLKKRLRDLGSSE